MPAAQVQSAPSRTMQGIAVPAESVNPAEFFALTRRHQTPEKQVSYGGGGVTQVVELRKADILSTISLRFVGTLTITGGTADTSAAWPLGLAGVRFTANGQSNLINTGIATPAGGGLQHLRARELMKNGDLTDRGVTQTIGGVARNQGTMAYAHESWGVGSNTATIAAGTYNVDLTFPIPVSEDEKDLVGAIFLQTSTSDLTLSIDETPLTQLVKASASGGATSITLAGNWQVATTKFSIPVGANGQIVVPNLNVFHSLIASRFANGISNGENENRIIGQGAGKSLIRVYGRVVSGAGNAAAPLAVNATNYGPLSWRFGNNETPDSFLDGSAMRANMERNYSSDLCTYQGYWAHDFASGPGGNAFRDVVDMGTTSELRLVTTLQSGVSLTNPALEYVTETVFLAA